MVKVLVVGNKPDGAAIHVFKDSDGNLTTKEKDTLYAQQSALTAQHTLHSYTAVIVSSGLDDMLSQLTRLSHVLGPFNVLDVVDHGSPGYQTLGHDTLCKVGQDGKLTAGGQLAAQIGPLLADDAKLRLLGCETAAGDLGRAMLARLGTAFERGVVVYGTLARIAPATFDTGIFSQATDFLFSSEAAIDASAPDMATHSANLARWAE